MGSFSGAKSKQGSPRKLGEHLQEQQEPFVLEVYLLERGCTRKSSSGCFWKLIGRKKSTDVAKRCSEMAKSLCKKIITLKGPETEEQEEEEGVSMEESERLSFVSMSTELNSLSDIEAYLDCVENQEQQTHQQDQLVTERMRKEEESKQYSPDSVLDEIEQSPVYDVRLSGSLLNLLKRSGRKEKEGVSESNCSRYTSSKKALQQSRQLLFDCVREVVEKQGRKQRKREHLMGSEELGRIICENLRVWSKGPANKKKITRMLRSDLLQSFEEWESFDGFEREIEKEVGDRILQELQDELVEEVMDLCVCKILLMEEDANRNM